MKPTVKQTKEFWEKRGLKQNEEYGRVCWEYEGKYVSTIIPSTDTNKLFRYAVPKNYQQIIFQPGYCGITVEDKLYEGSGDTPEESLFWALSEVLL